MTAEQALDCPVNQALALLAFHLDSHPMCPMEMVTDGYIAQEYLRTK